MYPPPSSHLNLSLATHAWALYRSRTSTWLAASGCVCGLQLALWYVLAHFLRAPEPDDPTPRYLLLVLLLALTNGLNRVFQVMLCRLALDQLAGEPLKLKCLFRPVAGLWTVLLTSLVAAGAIQLGYTLMVIPGLILEGLFLLVNPILAERRLGARAALKLSVETLQRELINAVFFGMFLNFLTVFAGGVLSSPLWPLSLAGIVLVYPFVPQIQALLYRSYFSYKSFEYRP